MTTYQRPEEQPMTPGTALAFWAAVARDLAIVFAVVVYAIDQL